jgi:phage terminase large subunit-like protein
VLEAKKVKLSGKEIRRVVLGFVERALERGHVVIVRIETNQGGDLWLEILHDMPVRVKAHAAGTASKNVRAAEAVHHYETKRVEHAPGLTDVEGEMVAFPRAPHDDYVDAVGAAVRYFLTPRKRTKAGGVSESYA